MTELAAPGDTWGVPGLQFLAGYLVLAVGAAGLLLALRHRLIAKAGADRPPPDDLDPFMFALLSGGIHRVVPAALAGLRARQLITATAGGGIVVTGPPSGLHPVELAVYQAIAAGRNRPASIGLDGGVRNLVAAMRGHLQRTGVFLAGPERTRYRLLGLVLLPVLLLGVARFVAGTSNGKPVGYLTVVLTLLAITQFVALVASPPLRTKTGTELVARYAQRYDHLQPEYRPSWVAYGSLGAAMGVAVFGAEALIAADPVFATEAQLRQQLTNSSSGSDSSSSCSGGSSCGGGGCGG